MRHTIISLRWLGVACLLLSSLPVFAGDQRPSSLVSEQRPIRTLMSHWIAAYRNLDAKRLASLEALNVETVDRFGQLHVPSGRNENEKLWSDAFEMVSRNTVPPSFTVNSIRFVQSDVALVQVICTFPEGILLVDGERLPSFSQVETFVVTRRKGVWVIAAHNMQAQMP